MKTWLRIPLVSLVLGPFALEAQDQHFPEMKWKERELEHFTLRADGTSHDPARRYAEEVWEECEEVFPGIAEDFAGNGFRTPGGGRGAGEAPYRFTVYLVGSGHAYGQLLEADKERNGWNENHIRSCRITRSYNDPQNRYRVLCKADPESSGGGGERDLTPSFVHGTASALLSSQCQSGNLPFWFTAGWGYYVEHRLFDLCRVYYLDFEAYYARDDAEIIRGGALGHEDPWPPAIRKLCRKDVRESLEKVCTADIITLSPNQSGYIFALTCFLVSSDERVGHYNELIEESRQGGEIDKDTLLSTYGYDSDEAFEADWYDFLESSKFK
jgi:hypothetical protein